MDSPDGRLRRCHLNRRVAVGCGCIQVVLKYSGSLHLLWYNLNAGVNLLRCIEGLGGTVEGATASPATQRLKHARPGNQVATWTPQKATASWEMEAVCICVIMQSRCINDTQTILWDTYGLMCYTNPNYYKVTTLIITLISLWRNIYITWRQYAPHFSGRHMLFVGNVFRGLSHIGMEPSS